MQTLWRRSNTVWRGIVFPQREGGGPLWPFDPFQRVAQTSAPLPLPLRGTKRGEGGHGAKKLCDQFSRHFRSFVEENLFCPQKNSVSPPPFFWILHLLVMVPKSDLTNLLKLAIFSPFWKKFFFGQKKFDPHPPPLEGG